MAGKLLIQGLSFFLIPLYTHYMEPSDYGILGICATISAVFVIIASPPLQAAVSLFYFKLERKEYRKFLGMIWLWMLLVPLILIGVLYTFSAKLSFYFPRVSWNPYLQLSVWIGYFELAPSIPLALFTAFKKPFWYVSFNLLSFVMDISLLIYFVAVRHGGALGSLHGQLIGAGAIAVFSHVIVLSYSRFKWVGRYLVDALKLCMPYIPHVTWMWVLNVSDRWILLRFVPLASIGIYNLAYTLGVSFYLFSSAMMTAYSPVYYEKNSAPSFRKILPHLLTVYWLTELWMVLALILLAPEIVKIISPPAYHSAWFLVPWIAAGYWLAAAIYQPCLDVLHSHQRTRWVMLISGIPAILNIVLNFKFIPSYGIQAAAVNTFLAFALMAVLAVLVSKKFDRLPFPWMKLGQMIPVVFIAYLIGSTFHLFLYLWWIIVLTKGALLVVTGTILIRIAGFDIRTILTMFQKEKAIETISS